MGETLLLRGAKVLELSPPRVEQADLRIRDGQIVERGRLSVEPADRVEDLTGKWLIPGLVCAHTHLYSALACGMPLPNEAPKSFAEQLEKVWWKLDIALDAEAVEVSALVGGLRALQAGTTTIVDHHASPNFIRGSLEKIDGALQSIGVRRILCYEVTDRGGLDRAEAGIQAHHDLLAAGPDGMRAVLMGGHASFTLSDDTLRKMVKVAQSAGCGLHLHLAEAVDDRQLTGEALVDRLERLGALLPGSIFAHAVHLSASELDRLGNSQCWITHQARSNMNNGVGYAPVGSFPAQRALGTDGLDGDMLAELKAAYFKSQDAHQSMAPSEALDLLCGSASLASQKLGVSLGRLTPGSAADLVVLDATVGPPLLTKNLAAALIFRITSAQVRHVMVAGAWRLRDRQPTGVDVAQLEERAARVAQAVWKRMEAVP